MESLSLQTTAAFSFVESIIESVEKDEPCVGILLWIINDSVGYPVLLKKYKTT